MRAPSDRDLPSPTRRPLAGGCSRTGSENGVTHWSLGLDAPSSSPAAMMNRASLFTRRRSRQPANTRKKRDPIYELNLPVPESIYNAFVRSLARALSRRVRDVRYRTVPLALRLIARLAQQPDINADTSAR